MDYKASKAWHFGHDLAIAVHALVQDLPPGDEFGLRDKLRHASALAPTKIAESLEKELRADKLECYKLAREAVSKVQVHLSLARDLHYIELSTYEELAGKAIVAHNLLSDIIRSLQASPAT